MAAVQRVFGSAHYSYNAYDLEPLLADVCARCGKTPGAACNLIVKELLRTPHGADRSAGSDEASVRAAVVAAIAAAEEEA